MEKAHMISFAKSLKGRPPKVLTQDFADVTDCFKNNSWEADSQSHCLHVWQAEAKHFMLRGKEKLCICLDSTFVQSPVRFQKPAFFLFPPKRKVWPVLGYVYKKGEHNERQWERALQSQLHCVAKTGTDNRSLVPHLFYNPRLGNSPVLFKVSKVWQVENRLKLPITIFKYCGRSKNIHTLFMIQWSCSLLLKSLNGFREGLSGKGQEHLALFNQDYFSSKEISFYHWIIRKYQ